MSGTKQVSVVCDIINPMGLGCLGCENNRKKLADPDAEMRGAGQGR